MAKPTTREQKARIGADAELFGVEEAAKRHSISERTVRRYRAMAAADPDLAREIRERKALVLKQEDLDWATTGRRFLRRSLAKLEELVQQAKAEPGSIREVAGAIKIVGELDVVRSALGGEQPDDPEPGEETPAPPGGVATGGAPGGAPDYRH